MLFDLNKLHEKTPNELKRYYIYSYQFSLMANTGLNLKTNESLNEFLDKIIYKYKDLPLERLWVALYFESTLALIRDINMDLLSNSIKKTLNQLSSIDSLFIENHINLIDNLLSAESISVLLERPYIFFKNSKDPLFKEIVKVGEGLRNDLSFYEECFNKKKSVLSVGYDEVTEYMDMADIILEAWYTFVSFFINDEIAPIMHSLAIKTKEEITNDLLAYIELTDDEVNEETLKTLSPIDVYFDKKILNDKLSNFLTSITNKKKDVKLLLPVFLKYTDELIRNYANI